MTEHLTLDLVARAIYETHLRRPPVEGFEFRPAPVWTEASEAVREWVFAQARSAIDAYEAVHGKVRQ